MASASPLDCVVIGYYEPPFSEYANLVRGYGEQSPAYRDLRLSFATVDGRCLNYVDLLNYASDRAGNSLTLGARRFKSGDIPNLAAVYLTNFLRMRNINAAHINLFEFEQEQLAEYLASGPICVAITTTFYVVNLPVIEMVRFIRRKNPAVKIVVGGPLIANHFRNYAGSANRATGSEGTSSDGERRNSALQAVLDDIGADIYINEPQGELTLYRVIRCLQTGAGIDQVPNIAYSLGAELYVTPMESENNSLDDNVISWTGFSHSSPGRTIQVRTARSCAFNCAFCNYPTRAGKLTLARLETIKQELDSIRAIGEIENVVFIDDTFNVPLPRFKDICRLMINEHYGFNWFSYFRCSNADEEAIQLMAKSGCRGVFLGIESGSPTILDKMNKAATIDKYAEGIRRLKDHRILTFASFIAGFPGETADTLQETRDFIERYAPDYYRVQLWYCEPGTPIDHQRAHYGIEGHGFGWRHASMTSIDAMRHIESMFLQIERSTWLPQWSFDFWIIPYLLGRGITLDQLHEFVRTADDVLVLEIRGVSGKERTRQQNACLQSLTSAAAQWELRA